jgi:hypothetical protein
MKLVVSHAPYETPVRALWAQLLLATTFGGLPENRQVLCDHTGSEACTSTKLLETRTSSISCAAFTPRPLTSPPGL